MMDVRVFKTLLTLLLLANWFACTENCQLKKSRLVQNLAGHGRANFQAVSNNADDSRICNWIASGGCKNSESKIVVPKFVMTVLSTFWQATLDEQGLALKSDLQTEWSTAPPELSPTVHFTSRAALPARAPSIAS